MSILGQWMIVVWVISASGIFLISLVESEQGNKEEAAPKWVKISLGIGFFVPIIYGIINLIY